MASQELRHVNCQVGEETDGSQGPRTGAIELGASRAAEGALMQITEGRKIEGGREKRRKLSF